MNRKLVFDNRLCYEREVARQHSIHHQKLDTVLPTSLSPSRVYLDSSAPAKHPHLATNAKRLQIEREKQLLIYQQNQRIADRMQHIMHRQENAYLATSHTLKPAPPPPATSRSQSIGVKEREDVSFSPSTSTPPIASTRSPNAANPRSPRKQPLHSPARIHIPGVRLDANQTPLVDCHLSPEFALGRGNACNKQTLVNKVVQRRKQAQIDVENQRLAQRLANLKPFYNTKRWDGEWQQHSKKFGHLRQDGTVGYLLPSPPRTAPGTDRHTPARRRPSSRQHGGGLPSIRSHKEGKQVPSEHGKQHPSHVLASVAQRQEGGWDSPRSNDPNEGGLREEGDEEEEEMQLVELPASVLLEATTRKGVEIIVSELPIELSKLSESSKTEIGDRGFVVLGTWSDGSSTFEGRFMIDLPLLVQVAQEIDDLETMYVRIKLETVVQIPDVGNFPRLSVLLTEEELQQLLVGVIHHLRFQLLTDTKELRITCRFTTAVTPPTLVRPPRVRAESDPLAGSWRDHTRPKTCPSTHPREPLLHEGDGEVNADDAPALEATRLDEVASVNTNPTPQLANLMRGASSRRFGVRVGGKFVLVTSRFDAQSNELVATLLNVSTQEPSTQDMRVHVDSAEAEAMVCLIGIGMPLREIITDQLNRAAQGDAE